MSDVALTRTRVVLRANRLQWMGKTAGSPLRCDIPFKQINKVEVRFTFFALSSCMLVGLVLIAGRAVL